MARVRGKTTKGRGGAVQCSKEGCKFGPEQIVRCAGLDGETSPPDCFLQLRLRAGDVEDAGGGQWVAPERVYLPGEDRPTRLDDLKRRIHDEVDAMWREEVERSVMSGERSVNSVRRALGYPEPDITLVRFEQDVLDRLNERLDPSAPFQVAINKEHVDNGVRVITDAKIISWGPDVHGMGEIESVNGVKLWNQANPGYTHYANLDRVNLELDVNDWINRPGAD